MKRIKKAFAVLLVCCMFLSSGVPVLAATIANMNSGNVAQNTLYSSGTKVTDVPSGDEDLMFITLAENTSLRWNANGSANKNNVIHLDDYSGKNCYFRFHQMQDGFFGIKHIDKAKSENISNSKPEGEETGLYVDIDGKSTDPGAVLHLWESDDNKVQDNDHRQFAFYFVKEENGNKYYYIKNKKSDLWVGYEDTDHDGQASVDDKLIQTDEANRKLWIITNGVVPKNGDEDEEIIQFRENGHGKEDGAFVEIFLNDTLNSISRVYFDVENGTSMHLITMGTSCKWVIKWDGPHRAYTIHTVLDNEEVSDYVWDLQGQVGSRMHLWEKQSKKNNRNTNQYWRFIKQGDGTYKIQNARTGQYVTGVADNGTVAFHPLSASGEGTKFTVSAFAGTDTEVNFRYATDWMATIPDDVLLSSVNIPGSHDTGTAAVVDDECQNYSLSQCQKYYFGEQLNVGVRSFDVRCDAQSDTASLSEVNIVHGSSIIKCFDRDGNKLTLQSLLNDSVRFLKNHPTETIIMMVKPDDGSVEGLAHALNAFITGAETKDYVYDKGDIPSMAEARGKIVFIRRFDIDTNKYTSPGFGISLSNWDDYNYMDYKQTIEIYKKDGITVNVQDAYNADVWDKREYIEGAMKQTVGGMTCRLLNRMHGYLITPVRL